MRPRHHTSGRAWSINLSSTPMPAAPAQTFALDLPIEQRFALVFLRRSGSDSAAVLVCDRLNQDKVPFPSGRHWHELRREGYVTYETGTRAGVQPGHRLTPKGLRAAHDVMKDFCFRFSIHTFTHSGGRGSGGGTWSRCSCGTWSTGPHNNDRFGESRIRSAQNAHIKDVSNGLWPTRSLTDFLNQVDPPRFDLNSGAANPRTDVVAGGPDDPGAVSASVSAAASGIHSNDQQPSN